MEEDIVEETKATECYNSAGKVGSTYICYIEHHLSTLLCSESTAAVRTRRLGCSGKSI